MSTTVSRHENVALAVPTVHLNGTGGQALADEYRHAYEKLIEAVDALRAVTVHGRDYYVNDPKGDDTYANARAQQDERLSAVGQVAREVGAIAAAVQEQVWARDKGRR